MSSNSMSKNSIVIAIDGTFASGKGTLGKRLAAHMAFAYLDTGKLYRAVAAKALSADADLSDGALCAGFAASLSLADLDDPSLKSGPVGAAASKVAVHTQVRDALLHFQRNFAQKPPKPFKGAVLDGRDIGTVICPDARIKLYVDADPEVRAERRHKELVSYGEDITFGTVLAQLQERDHRDMNRDTAPLKPAANAHLLDTTNLSIDAAFTAAISIVEAALK